MQSKELEDYANCCRTFAEKYEVSSLPAMREVERSVLGCDYGGTSWTTTDQAQQIIRLLKLGSGDHLLDIGAGSGWPGLYLASESGCEVTLLDMPVNALQKASERAEIDGIGERVGAVAASGAALPFANASFDFISHSDVMCCLPDKVEMLNECRRVATKGAQMLFSVIAIPEDLDKQDYERVITVGPPFVEAPGTYPEILDRTGWEIDDRFDVTDDHRSSLRKLVEACETSTELSDAIGSDVVRQTREHRLEQIALIDAGLMKRDVYVVSAI